MKNLIDKFNEIQYRIATRIHTVARDEEGATMIEYALIAALISVVAITALTGVGQQLVAKLTDILNALQ